MSNMSDEIGQAAEAASSAAASSAQHLPANGTGAETAGADTQPSADQPRGPIPFADHERVVDGFHRRYDELMERLGWANGLKREEVEEALTLRRHAQRDRETPTLDLAHDLQDEHGQPLYSQRRLTEIISAAVARAVSEQEGKLAERLSPVESLVSQIQVSQSVSDQIDQAMEWPEFSTHMGAINQAILQANRQGRRLSLHDAYIQVVLPKLVSSREDIRKTEREAILKELNATSAATSSDLKPDQTPSSRRKKPEEMTTVELFEEVAAEMAKR